jgi:site-specific recombinase XerD
MKSCREVLSKAGINKFAGCRTFKNAFAIRLLEDGYDIRTVRELLGHSGVRTTMVYAHVLNRGGKGVISLQIVPEKPISKVF